MERIGRSVDSIKSKIRKYDNSFALIDNDPCVLFFLYVFALSDSVSLVEYLHLIFASEVQ